MTITKTQLEELKTIIDRATEGLVDARTSAEKLKSIGVTMDLSKLETEVERLQTEYFAAEQEFLAQQTKPKFGSMVAIDNPSLPTLSVEERLTRLELALVALKERK